MEALKQSRALAWAEVFISWALIEATMWTSGLTQASLFCLSLLFLIGDTAWHRPNLRQIGLGLKGLRGSFWVIPASAALAGAAAFTAWMSGSLHLPFASTRAIPHSIGYAVWAVFQQFLLQCFFFLRLERLLDARAAVILSAALFSLVHIPNPVLVVVCLLAGMIACDVFRRHRNIYALGVAHGLLGLTIAVTVPDAVQRHMKVGLGYYTDSTSTHARLSSPIKKPIQPASHQTAQVALATQLGRQAH